MTPSGMASLDQAAAEAWRKVAQRGERRDSAGIGAPSGLKLNIFVKFEFEIEIEKLINCYFVMFSCISN